ncbi:hypothetical protein AAG570_009428 [Ranatra chinensis]|uniref:Uncharacterized protein n=1 Tax=Ranatra chinensis TaxID=642074 RepID=A0ABD0YP53_9HEMI
MAPKRRNMFHKNKKQETTEIVPEGETLVRLADDAWNSEDLAKIRNRRSDEVPAGETLVRLSNDAWNPEDLKKIRTRRSVDFDGVFRAKRGAFVFDKKASEGTMVQFSRSMLADSDLEQRHKRAVRWVHNELLLYVVEAFKSRVRIPCHYFVNVQTKLAGVIGMLSKAMEVAHRRYFLASDVMEALLTEHVPRPPSLRGLRGGFKGRVWEGRALISGLELDLSLVSRDPVQHMRDFKLNLIALFNYDCYDFWSERLHWKRVRFGGMTGIA